MKPATAQRTKIFEGAVDGIATDNGKFWIKDAEGKKLIDDTPALPNRSVAFKLVADTLNSGKFPAPKAIGHRTVSGSPTVLDNQLITPELIDDLDKYADLAPLHTPIAVYIMREALKLFPGIPNFAVLDTYFHRTMPEVAKRMPIPDEYVDMGVRRYGYHGISYESIIYQLQPNIPEKLIVAHLGNGASISAIRNGECLDTSMGLTPTGGIISGSRTGDIDPGVVHLHPQARSPKPNPTPSSSRRQLETVVSKKSGLLGVSGLSNDMRDLREAIKQGNAKARLAVDKFTWTIAQVDRQLRTPSSAGSTCWSSPAASAKTTSPRAPKSAPGLKRSASCIDPARNNVRGEATISADNSRVTVRVIPPAEDLMIVNHVIRLLGPVNAGYPSNNAVILSARPAHRGGAGLLPPAR